MDGWAGRAERQTGSKHAICDGHVHGCHMTHELIKPVPAPLTMAAIQQPT